MHNGVIVTRPPLVWGRPVSLPLAGSDYGKVCGFMSDFGQIFAQPIRGTACLDAEVLADKVCCWKCKKMSDFVQL
jgi:hypothetical protein